MRYDDKLMIMPDQFTLAPPICRFAGEVLSIGRRVMQKGVVTLFAIEWCFSSCICISMYVHRAGTIAEAASLQLFDPECYDDPTNTVRSLLECTNCNSVERDASVVLDDTEACLAESEDFS